MNSPNNLQKGFKIPNVINIYRVHLKISCDFPIVLKLSFYWLSTPCRIGLCSQYFRGNCHIQCQGESKHINSANTLYPAYRPLPPHANT